jgi:NAD(P)-dependent dehydrogenase (short-subunit alcohol dehydrogenase family)
VANTLQDKTVVVVGRGSGIADVAGAALFAMNNTFMTAMTLKVDGGEPLI